MHPTSDAKDQSKPVDTPSGPLPHHGLAVIDNLMAGGELLPAQLPSASNWTPEKRLAAAVLASALIEIRDHHGSAPHRRHVAETLRWIRAEEDGWPFGFVRLCALFDLDVDWVREEVARWINTPRGERKSIPFLYRWAA